MGAAASAIPDIVNKETFINLAKNQYSATLFEKYSEDGVLSKEKVIYLIHQSDVFLSFHDGNDSGGRDIATRVAKLNEALKGKHLVTGLSVEQTSDMRDKAITAIENTRVVIVLLTQSYINKVYGRHSRSRSKIEFSLAVRRKGSEKIIPIIMEDTCADPTTWKGPIGVACQGKVPIDYRNDDQLDTVVQQVYDAVAKLTVPLLSEHATFTIPQPSSSANLLASPKKVLRCPEDFHHHYDTSDGKIICLQCDKTIQPVPTHTWGNGWSCDWPTHEGPSNAFMASDAVYGCDTFHACNFGVCKTCYDRVITGHDTFTSESPGHCIKCKFALFMYPPSFVDELGGQWACDSANHRGNNLFSSEEHCYGCMSTGDCQYLICEQCFRRGAMSATARDAEEEHGGIVLHGGGMGDDDEPIFD